MQIRNLKKVCGLVGLAKLHEEGVKGRAGDRSVEVRRWRDCTGARAKTLKRVQGGGSEGARVWRVWRGVRSAGSEELTDRGSKEMCGWRV